jgi:hypothetical protein
MAKPKRKPGSMPDSKNAQPRRAAPRSPRWMPWVQHALPGSVFVLYWILWQTAPEWVPRLGQEDSWIEWATVAAFGSASVAFALIGLKRGFRDGWFAWGLALFCFLVAGEEVSWGQRLVGFVPPEIFLEKNYQEESNIHNLLAQFVEQSWMVIFLLATWGVLFPILRLAARKVFESLRVIEPPIALVPWSILGIILLRVYPLEMTAEYVELITGLLFLATAIPMLELSRRTYVALGVPVVAAIAAASYQNLQDTFGSPQKLACAEAETKALASAIEGGAGLPRLFGRRLVDIRVHTLIQDGYLKPEIIKSLDAVACEGVSKDPNRRRFALDPWGQPYWMYYERDRDGGSGTALFYSFGENRRYDSSGGKIEGTDDVGARSRPLSLATGLPE